MTQPDSRADQARRAVSRRLLAAQVEHNRAVSSSVLQPGIA